MSMDNDDSCDCITTESPSGSFPSAAMKQVSVGAKAYSPLCGPLPMLTLPVLPILPAWGNAGAASSADALATGDIKLTHSVLAYARHLSVGRIAPTRVSVEVDYGNHTPDPADILKKIADGRDANAGISSFEPPHEGYKVLKAKLAEFRSNGPRADADERIAAGPAIKPGDKDARVPQLRERLKIAFKPPGPETMQVRDRRTGQIKLVKVNLPEWTEGCDADPKAVACDYPLYTLNKIVATTFAENGGDAYTLVKNFSWTNEDQNQVAEYITNEGMSADEAGAKWVDDNEAKWKAWMPAS